MYCCDLLVNGPCVPRICSNSKVILNCLTCPCDNVVLTVTLATLSNLADTNEAVSAPGKAKTIAQTSVIHVSIKVIFCNVR